MLALVGHGFFADPAVGTFSATVVPVSTCNLACPYCIQNLGPAGGRRRPPRIPAHTMSPEVVEGAIRFLRSRMELAGLDSLDLLLFGGEPLTRPDICLDLLERAPALGLRRAEVVTNGTRLTPQLASSLAGAGVTAIQVTFDGDRIQHDQVRVVPGGLGTFDRILDRLAAAQASGPDDWRVRVNVSAGSVHRIYGLIDELANCLDVPSTTISFDLVDDTGVGYLDVLPRNRDTAESLVSLFRTASERGFRISPWVSNRRCVYCGDGEHPTGAVIDADGTLYSCWEAVGRVDQAVGDVDRGFAAMPLRRARWSSCGARVVKPPGEDISAFRQILARGVLEAIVAKEP
jgi:uncharacterized protein